MADRWIYGFRKTGKRNLTESEVTELGALGRRMNGLRFARGLIAVSVFMTGLAGVLYAAGGSNLGWALLVLGSLGFFWTVNWASGAERLSLLYRRAARVGIVDRYEREGATDPVRDALDKSNDSDGYLVNPYWEAEERFEETLRKEVGHRPEAIETPVDDHVLVTIDGAIVGRTIDVPAVLF